MSMTEVDPMRTAPQLSLDHGRVAPGVTQPRTRPRRSPGSCPDHAPTPGKRRRSNLNQAPTAHRYVTGREGAPTRGAAGITIAARLPIWTR